MDKVTQIQNGQEQSDSTNLIDRTIENLKYRRDRVMNGEINCIPLPFSRFRTDMPGIEQGTYYLVSGLSKSSKTQLTNYLFVYNSLLYAYDNPDKLSVKFFYFPLEETPESITLRFISYLLWIKYKIKVSPTDLKSTNNEKPLDQDIIDKLHNEDIQSILRFYESKVEFLSDRNPTGVWKVAKNYAENNGKTFYKDLKIKDKNTGLEETMKVFDYYTPNNPNEYVFIIVDHVSLIDPEKGSQLRESINKLSEYMVILRNRYNYIPVVVQQQSVNLYNSIFLLIFCIINLLNNVKYGRINFRNFKD